MSSMVPDQFLGLRTLRRGAKGGNAASLALQRGLLLMQSTSPMSISGGARSSSETSPTMPAIVRECHVHKVMDRDRDAKKTNWISRSRARRHPAARWLRAAGCVGSWQRQRQLSCWPARSWPWHLVSSSRSASWGRAGASMGEPTRLHSSCRHGR